MDKNTFARRHGFDAYETMLGQSTSIIYDDGLNYFVTQTQRYYLAWIEKYPENPLGRFSSFQEAQTFLITAFKEAEEMAHADIPVRLVSALGESSHFGG